MPNVLRKYGIFLFIPGIVLVYSILLRIAAGPFSLATNFDPSYLYLCNGLHILKGVPLNDATHPGTPLQLLCCWVSWAFNIGRPLEDAVLNVLRSPDFYLQAVFLILSLFSFFTSAGLGVYVFLKTGDKLIALLTQLPALSFLVLKSWESPEPVLPVVANVSPEPLLMGMLNLFNICLLMDYFSQTAKDKYISAILWGAVGGMATAVKFTFFPLLAVPMIVLSWRNRGLFLGVFTVTFFVWTLPALSKYPLEWDWIKGFLIKGGGYGANEQGRIDLPSYCLNWTRIIVEYKVFAGFAAAGLLMVFWKWVNKKWEKTSFYILAAIIGILVQFSIVAKNPGAHYLLPGLGLFSAVLALFYLQSDVYHLLDRRIVYVFIIVFTLAGIWRAGDYLSNLASLTRDIISFEQHIRSEYKGYIILGYYRSSGQDGAIRFGDAWNGERQLAQEAYQAYPNSYFFNRGGANRIVNFKDRVLSDDLMIQSSGVLFEGDYTYGKDLNLSSSPFSLRLLERGRFESVYLLTKTTEKKALMSFIASVHFLQAGDYPKALAFALQAKNLHYQPEDSVDEFIQSIIPYVRH